MSFYKVSAKRAKEFLDMPDELPTRPAGWTGASVYSGRLGSEFEHLQEFSTPRERALTIGKMLRTSAPLALAEEYLTGRITAVPLMVKRTSEKSEEAANALERWLGIGKYQESGGRLGSNMSIDGLLRHLLSARMYGHCAMSESWHYDKQDKLFYCTLHRRRQESYDSYITEEKTDKLLAIGQRVGTFHGKPKTLVLPLNQTLWIVHREDLGWYDGRSVLRSVYPHWRSEQLRFRLEDLAANRWAAPPMQGALDVESFAKFANTGGQPVNREDYATEIADLAEELKTLDSSSEGHLLHASWWTFSPVNQQPGSYDPAALLNSAQFHQRCMMERLYVSWLSLGRQGSAGSYNMASVQSQVVQDATIDCLQWICNALNRQTARRFLAANFSKLEEKDYPVISFQVGAVKSAWWQNNAQAFAQFVSQGIITMSEKDERAIRAASDLPPVEDLPDKLDRQAMAAGGRLNTIAGQREAARPGESRQQPNPFVERLVEAGQEDDS